MGLLNMQNAILMAAPHIESASGSIASFDTNFPAKLKSCVVDINPVQAGSGDPSPDNVRAISGWTGVQIHRTGVNLLSGDDLLTVLAKRHTFTPSEDDAGRYISFSASNASSYFRIRRKDVPFKEKTPYTIIAQNSRSSSGNQNIKIFYTDGTSEVLWSANTTPTIQRKVSDANKTISYIGGSNSGGTTTLYIDTFGIFEGDVAIDDYTTYQGAIVPITFPDPPGTMYSGTLDVLTGVLTVTHALISFDGSEDGWSESSYFMIRLGSNGYIVQDSGICSHAVMNNKIAANNTQYGFRLYNRSVDPKGATFLFRTADIKGAVMTLAEFKTWLGTQAQNGTPLQALYELSNPVTYQLNPVTLAALKGQNNLWADCGDVALKYWKH